MIVLHPNTEQYNQLNGYQNGRSILEFVLDASNRYVIGIEILDDPIFEAIHEELNKLERIEFTPFPEPEEEIIQETQTPEE